MKYVLYAIAMLCTAAGFSQQGGSAYITQDATRLVYNNGKDSIQLSNPDLRGFPMCQSAEIVAEVQIDGKGAKEVVVKRSIEWIYMLLGDEFNIREKTDRTVYEVWNVDNKKLLFSAVGGNHFSYISHYRLSSAEGAAHYNYDFSINEAGAIAISNVQVSGFPAESGRVSKEYRKFAKPDHKEGIYTFKNGKYSKQ
ncbi:hypothetical protein AM493_13310 [Flavobacterium akiainvivens]|uniref:Uncharacterized protein n=1 Tax=Flavobacterium akiainvivens TaxID=1202724 RepID=A0A0M8MJL7_9FLAO|nr:hypothetical protein [Flavobacterium akiainvivens]KOS06898.1 hypothetical protein AM493_13310 [Flavobacterium akiainvivens]SFQ69616.1 hypothetical protein SAMN05444144_11555 [Flavobacterium akiainvivens]